MLSTKDRDRLKILHEVKRKHLTQRAAAQQLGISDRWVRKLLVRIKKEGVRVKYLGRFIEDCVLLTDVWVKDDGQWRALRRHSTPAPGMCVDLKKEA